MLKSYPDRVVRRGLPLLAALAMLAASGARHAARAQRAGASHSPVADTQRLGRIVGTVRDSAGAPVSDATVQAGPGLVARTDSKGAFALSGLPTGPIVLTVKRIGFAPAVSMWELGAFTLSLNLRIHAFPRVLSTVYAMARPEVFDSRLAGFNKRRTQGFGYYITRGDLDSLNINRLTDVLERIPGVRPYRMPNSAGTSVTLAGARCPPLVMVDGFPASIGSFDLNMIDPTTVEGIEVYQHGSSVPAALAGSYGTESCGLIAIWSRPMRPNVRADQLPPEHPPNLDSLLAANVVYTAATVDQAASYGEGSAVPTYPDSLFRARVPGHVEVRFVVDTTGKVELQTVEVVSATRPEFADAVRLALRTAAFSPATLGGAPVRQLVTMPFDFKPVSADSVPRQSQR